MVENPILNPRRNSYKPLIWKTTQMKNARLLNFQSLVWRNVESSFHFSNVLGDCLKSDTENNLKK